LMNTLCLLDSTEFEAIAGMHTANASSSLMRQCLANKHLLRAVAAGSANAQNR
jgi:hypothetical protein